MDVKGWNYRVIEFVDPLSGPWRSIHEVYYDDEGRPFAYMEDPAGVISDEGDGFDLSGVLDMMRSALDKPVLVEKDFEAARDPDRQ